MLQRAGDESAREVDVAEGSHDPGLCPHLPHLHSQVALLWRHPLPSQGLYQVFLYIKLILMCYVCTILLIKPYEWRGLVQIK